MESTIRPPVYISHPHMVHCTFLKRVKVLKQQIDPNSATMNYSAMYRYNHLETAHQEYGAIGEGNCLALYSITALTKCVFLLNAVHSTGTAWKHGNTIQLPFSSQWSFCLGMGGGMLLKPRPTRTQSAQYR